MVAAVCVNLVGRKGGRSNITRRREHGWEVGDEVQERERDNTNLERKEKIRLVAVRVNLLGRRTILVVRKGARKGGGVGLNILLEKR